VGTIFTFGSDIPVAILVIVAAGVSCAIRGRLVAFCVSCRVCGHAAAAAAGVVPEVLMRVVLPVRGVAGLV
jgi:hypothetical protein